jgi:hypothetical protein
MQTVTRSEEWGRRRRSTQRSSSWRPDDGADADRTRSFGVRSCRRPVVVKPCRSPRPEHPQGNGIARQLQVRAEWERVWAPQAADDDRAAVTVEAEHPHLLRAEEPSDLFGDRAEYVRLGNFLRDECRDALKRSVFALAAASLGDVAPNGVDHARLGDGRRGPLDPLVRAVLAKHPVLERSNRRTCDDALCLLLAALAVVWMDELHERPCTPLALGVPEKRLDHRIRSLPVTVEPCEDDHLRSQREVPLDLGHRLSLPASRKGEYSGDGGEGEPSSEHEPRVPRRIHTRQHESGSSPRNDEQHQRDQAQTHVDPPRAKDNRAYGPVGLSGEQLRP